MTNVLLTFFVAQQIAIGKFQARAILNYQPNTALVILIPGSGAQGPEAISPGRVTLDGNDHSIFGELTEAFNKGGVSTLAVGKPGVEFGSVFTSPTYYNQDMFDTLRWPDLIENLREAVAYARTLPNVGKIYVLGHSEGTQVVADYAVTDPKLAGAIFLGYLNDSFRVSDEYQIYDEYVDLFLRTDVDRNHDGYIDIVEAALWPKDFIWSWQPGQQRISLQEISALRHADPALQARARRRADDILRTAVYDRPSISHELTPLKMPLFVFNGTEDVMTLPGQALALQEACRLEQKDNCYIHVVPGLGHGFSAPRPPRADPFLDFTFGPIAADFQEMLTDLAKTL